MTIDEINQRLDRMKNHNDRLDFGRKERSGRIWSNSSTLYGGRMRVRWVFAYTLTQGEEEVLLAGRYRAPYDNFIAMMIIACWPIYQILCLLLGLKTFKIFSRYDPFALIKPNVVPALIVFILMAAIFIGPEIYQALAKRQKHEVEEEEIIDLLRRQLKAVEDKLPID